MMKIKGFLMVESLIAIFIAFIAVGCLYIAVAENQKNGREIELKTDRVYAYHVLKEANLERIVVHNHVYEKAEGNYVFDKTAKKTISIKD